jgi:hypothetical protein
MWTWVRRLMHRYPPTTAALERPVPAIESLPGTIDDAVRVRRQAEAIIRARSRGFLDETIFPRRARGPRRAPQRNQRHP